MDCMQNMHAYILALCFAVKFEAADRALIPMSA